jgi:hypothetical protein
MGKSLLEIAALISQRNLPGTFNKKTLHEQPIAFFQLLAEQIKNDSSFTSLLLDGTSNLALWDVARIRAFFTGIAESPFLSTLVLQGNSLALWDVARIRAFVTGVIASLSLHTKP